MVFSHIYYWIKFNFVSPETTPDICNGVMFDPLFGFENGVRPIREPLSVAKLEASNLPFNTRDYCMEYQLAYQKCRRQTFPLVAKKCKILVHELSECYFRDYVIRVKEFERERRLMEREKRILKKEKSESLEES